MKKTMKKILAVVLSLAIVLTTVATGINDVSVFAVSSAGTTEEIDGNEEATENAEVVFVSVANGNYITTSGTANDDILVDNAFTTVDEVVIKGVFTTYYGTYANNGLDNVKKEVVNFTTNTKTTVWKADDEDIVYQYATNVTSSYSPTGWESVIIQHNDDGTISFASSADEKLFTIESYTGDDNKSHTRLAVSDKYHLGDEPTNNEKFVMYTSTAPKTAKKVTLSNIAGDCVDVSWTVSDEQLYSCFEVLYATTENGTYTSAGLTTDTKLTVKGLKSETQYFFKVRTLTNTKGTSSYSAYSDSAITYTTTLSASKPAQVEITGVERDESTGAQTITWGEAANAKSYNIYKATGRYAEYKYVTTTTSTSYTDTNPNTDSKYENYYSVESVNGNVTGEMSKPYSLEIDIFGEDMYVFNDTDDTEAIADVVNKVYQNQHYNQFGSDRYTFAFKEGDYTDMTDDTYNIGYYTQIIGLGKTPYDVRLKNVQTPAALANGNATCNFWVNIENLTIANTVAEGESFDYWEDSFKWAVSQAAPARRLNVERQTLLQWTWGDNAWASGGYIADSKFSDAVGSWCQQQYYYRNCEFEADASDAIYGINWNQMIQGCITTGYEDADGSSKVASGTLTDNSGYVFNAAGSLLQNNGETNWGVNGATTVIDTTDYVREKPFLYFDSDSDEYKVFVPSVQEDTTGVSWSETSMGTGISLSLDSFYVADPDTDTADTLNEALGKGYNLILSPGIYELDEALEVTYENTIILGLGMATLTPTDKNTDTLIRVAGKKWNSDYTSYTNVDIGGVEIAGIILDAGTETDTLIEVGYEGANVDHTENPCVLQDVICRVGGTGDVGTTEQCVVINSNNTIIDQTWIWRADHGDNVGWYENTSDNGLVVNGDNVTAYALFVEHFQEYDILWRGEYGKTYFLQNEKCYDPQSQEEWMSHSGTVNGYAAYKVTNNVEHHYAVGLGIYDVFINTNGASIYLDNAIEVPNAEDVVIENAVIVEIANGSGPTVGINSIINGSGYGITTGADSVTVSGKQGGYALQRLLYYRNGVSSYLPDDYDYDNETYPVDSETGLIVAESKTDVDQPSNDPDAEKTIKKETLTVDTSELLGTSETDDVYFANKIERCTEEWNKIHAAAAASSTDKTTDTTKEDNTQSSSYSVKVGDEYTVGDFIYRVTSLSGKSGTSTLIGVISSKRNTLTTATIPANANYNGYTLKVTSVGKKAMAKLKSLKKVVMGSNVTKIEKGAFQGCRKLTKIKFKNVKTIGNKAFYNCKKLKKVTIGSKTTSIGKSAFAKCKKLKKITIGKKVKKIKAKAFAKDNKIKKITFKGKVLKKVKKNAFSKKVKANMASKTTKLKGKKKSIKVLKKKLKIK